MHTCTVVGARPSFCPRELNSTGPQKVLNAPSEIFTTSPFASVSSRALVPEAIFSRIAAILLAEKTELLLPRFFHASTRRTAWRAQGEQLPQKRTTFTTNMSP